MMKKYLKIVAFSIMAGLTIGAAYVAKSLAYAEIERRSCTPRQNTKGLVVAVIGDSWVAGNKLDGGIARGLADFGVVASVRSMGISGARSRLILENFPDFERSISREFPEARRVFVIEGGINDSLAHVGSGYYVHHAAQLVDYAAKCGDSAIVLNIPAVDWDARGETLLESIRWGIYRRISGDTLGDNSSTYNTALTGILAPRPEVRIFDTRSAIGPDYRAKYVDGVHMRASDYEDLGYKLGKFAGQSIRP